MVANVLLQQRPVVYHVAMPHLPLQLPASSPSRLRQFAVNMFSLATSPLRGRTIVGASPFSGSEANSPLTAITAGVPDNDGEVGVIQEQFEADFYEKGDGGDSDEEGVEIVCCIGIEFGQDPLDSLQRGMTRCITSLGNWRTLLKELILKQQPQLKISVLIKMLCTKPRRSTTNCLTSLLTIISAVSK